MKKLLFLVSLFAFVAALPSALLAAFTPILRSTNTASVVFNEAPSGTLSVVIRNRIGDAATTELSWSDVTLGVTDWKAADQYLEVTNTYNRSGWGVQIFTNNTSAIANPQFTGDPADINPAGLLTVDNPNAGMLPLAWRVVDDTTDALNITQNATNNLTLDGFAADYYPFLWMKDRATLAVGGSTAFLDGEDYITVWNQYGGIHHAEATFDYFQPADNTAFVYLAAKFQNASTPNTYKTNTLTMELFWQ
ncbi:MAG: hypothetical protein ABII27_04620 [bacterium]